MACNAVFAIMTLEKIEEEDMPMTREEKIYRLWLKQKRSQGSTGISGHPKESGGNQRPVLPSFPLTAGLRDSGMGTNRMNCYVVGEPPKALPNICWAPG